MPYCEEIFVAKLDSMGESQFLSAQPCHKEETTLSHEGAQGTSGSCTKDCSSGTSTGKNPTAVNNVFFLMTRLILFLTLTLNLILIMIRSSQVKSILNMLYLVNLLRLVTHLLK